ncbi:hypothetical protein [Staphylococcus haemolyticus]|uniref:hypothetical protein n=1 Tax=Staphylococcus haemolyticus TaxID=1283 RepID=UPI001F568019|nr:hypothetical protein [Staphylococcus haemolyticus]MCI2943163.1 hypothetical protein [Staphylococcus haemolyticus]MCI2945339.1 hypothetical protein [Staphylococcus haemolyticus]
MTFDVIKWIILALIAIVTIAIICGLIWGSLLEERAYDKRSKKEKRKENEKNLEMAKGHTDNKGVDGDYEEAPTKEGTLKDEHINHREK